MFFVLYMPTKIILFIIWNVHTFCDFSWKFLLLAPWRKRMTFFVLQLWSDILFNFPTPWFHDGIHINCCRWNTIFLCVHIWVQKKIFGSTKLSMHYFRFYCICFCSVLSFVLFFEYKIKRNVRKWSLLIPVLSVLPCSRAPVLPCFSISRAPVLTCFLNHRASVLTCFKKCRASVLF